MATFPTPEPIEMTFEIIGDVRITASDRVDTVVAVRPGDASKAADVRAADETVVECRDGRLTVKTPKNWRNYAPFGGNGAVDVTVDLPRGSSVAGGSALGHIDAEGELGACRLKTALGDIRTGRTGALRAVTGFGALAVDHVHGHAELTTGSGDLRAGTIDGTAAVRNSNGDTVIGAVTGDLRVKAANGDISVGRAGASVVAKTANGDVRVAEVTRGTVVLETSIGEVAVGIRAGTTAWLDADTRFGQVHRSVDDVDGPPATGERVEVRARSSMGDIFIGRADPDDVRTTRPDDRSDAP